MKKTNLVKRNMKTVGALMMVATLAVGMTACGSKDDDNTALATFTPTESNQETVEGTQETVPETVPETTAETTPETVPVGDEAPFIGQITAIEENSVVLVKGEQPPIPEGGERPTKPEDGEQPIKPDDGQMLINPEIGGEAPEMPAEFTGETVTIAITENTSIIVNGENVTVAELAVDDIVSVVMDSDSVRSISKVS